MARSVLDLSLKQQKKLLGLKEQFGKAKTEAERQSISGQADILRSRAGITAGPAGQLSASQLGSVISRRVTTQRQEDKEARRQRESESLQAELFKKRERAKIAGFEKSRAAGLSALRGEEEVITPAFAGARRETRAVSERGAQRFGEFLAQRGLTRAGGAALGETQRLGAQQAALGGLAQQEIATIGDIARRRTGIEAGFASDVEAARAGLQAQQLQQQIAQQQAAPGIAAAQQQQAFENALAQARITGQFGGAPTLAAQQQQTDFAEGVRQFDANLDFKTKQFEATNALDLRQQSFNEIQDRINTGIRQGQLTVSQGNALLAKKKFEAENDPTSQAFIQRQEALRVGAETEPVTTTGFKTSPDFAEDLSQIINSTPEQKEILRQQLQQNAQDFITKYGLDGYQQLLAETEAF